MLAVFLLVIGTPFAVASPPLLFVAIVDRSVGALIGTAFGATWGSVLVPAGVAAWRISRSHPAIFVTDDGLMLEHPGLFVSGLHISRSAVHSVYVRRFRGAEPPPRFQGNAWQRLRQMSRWLDRGSPLRDSLPISSWHCPDLSLLQGEDHNLLIVMANSMPMRDRARRGLGALSVAVARGSTFTGPTKATVARGFFAVVLDEDRAGQAFASWPTAETPYPELWDWLYAGTSRGYGWLGWRSRRRARQPS